MSSLIWILLVSLRFTLLHAHCFHTTAFVAPQNIRNWQASNNRHYYYKTHLSISSGFSFEDGQQVLVSVQKPLGIVLEQDETTTTTVVEVDPNGAAGLAGIRKGDVLLAVQNASVKDASFEETMELIRRAPRVVNLRFLRSL